MGGQRSALHSQCANSKAAILFDKRRTALMISSSGPQCQHCCNIQIKPYVELFVSQIGWRIVLLRYFSAPTATQLCAIRIAICL